MDTNNSSIKNEKGKLLKRFEEKVCSIELMNGKRFAALVESIDGSFITLRSRKFASVHHLDDIRSIVTLPTGYS
jgi:hypothetical protein